MKVKAPWIRGHERILILCLFVVTGMATYWNSFGNSFQYDDEVVVVYNRNIQTLKNIPYFFVDPKMASADPHIAGHYRPLIVTSYAINYALGGLNPAGYHLVNLGFHVGSAFLIFLILKAMLDGLSDRLYSGSRRDRPSGLSSEQAASGRLEGRSKNVPPIDRRGFLTRPWVAALAAGLIFLVHPFNSEAVNYITARSSLMSGFFYLLAFYCWVKFRSKEQETRNKKQEGTSALTSRRSPLAFCLYIFSLLAFMAGMLSKEVLITLPIVLWLYDLYFHRLYPAPAVCSKGRPEDRPSGLSLRLQSTPASVTRYLPPVTYLNWRTYIPYIPFILIVVVPYIIIRIAAFGKALDPFQRDLATQLMTELPVLVKHWRMFLIPVPLTPFHPVEILKDFWTPAVILSALLLIGYATIAFFLSRRTSRAWRVVSFFMFWFFIVLLPTTIIPLNAIFQENRGYLATVSFAVFAGAVIGEIGRSKAQQVAVAILILLMLLYAGVTSQRNRVWKDEVTLWEDAAKKAPRSPEVFTALGVAYRRADMYNQAIDVSRKALELGGHNNFFAHDNLGRIYIDQGKLELAAHELELAIQGYPYKADTRNELGSVYYKQGRFDLAEEQLREAIRLDPGFYRPYYNLGVLYTRLGRIEDAIHAYQDALSRHPGHLRSWLHLGILLDETGRKDEAVEYYRHVIKYGETGEEVLVKEARRRLAEITGRGEGS